ncbi:predicted protein [Naegleria gruberi]|uniref:Predicted protein n=1 Tax=Naegleria gruberi TaxID=5762 RepID=D2W6H1_NAEGR|nr:uncharacterized protein NAEGRDRAFT_60100 [Naegleria gruberi]EFC35331.1 predicted protein [Naegleria gruberi]|eukprot:XP_002668075.1 predicted protein [Naegleria gruberi strain NEG-M]
MRGLFENFCYIEELVLTTKYDCPLSLMGIPSTIRKLVVNCNHSKIDDEDITKFLTNTGTVLKSLELNGGFPHIFGSFLQYLPQSLECVQIFGAQNFGVLELTFNNSLKTLRYDAEVVFTRTDDSFRRYFPNTRLMINSTTPLMTEVQPEQLLAKADEQSIRNWKLYSELPLDLLNAPFTHKGEEITVCFQPIDGKSKVLLKVSDKKWIYTSNNSIPSSETSIQSSKENKEEKKGSASSDTSNGMDLSMNTQQETVSNKTKKQNLLKKYEGYKGKLSELHTHLMGMGNAHFWIEFVMKKMIPELVASNPKVPKKIDPTECNNIDDLNLESIWTLHNSIPTTDVVYGVEELFIAFQLNDPRSKEEKEAHLSSIIGGEDPHHYIVYNVREGKNVDIYGYTNSQIINNLDNNPLLKAKLIKSFEMKYPGDYNGMFSPNFYPQRFSMKDCIYFMYPKVISALLLHTIFNYCEEGVSYVEYSVS